MTSILEVSVYDEVLADAEQCRRDAITLVGKESRYSELKGQPSAWCVVTEKGLWAREFHTAIDKDRLRDCIEKGHRAVLTVGLVSNPDFALHATKYASMVAYAEPRKHSDDKLADIAVRAKIRAHLSLQH